MIEFVPIEIIAIIVISSIIFALLLASLIINLMGIEIIIINGSKKHVIQQLKRNAMKHIICYSGGHSSALVAIEVVRKFGKENVILLNHDINYGYEAQDIKRFKKEVADYLGLKITYANIEGLNGIDIPSQFEVSIKAKSFINPATRQALCTNRLKTAPFMQYLEKCHADKNCIIYYGFDKDEEIRIKRRSGILGLHGYKTDFPLALWKDRTIKETEKIGIKRPSVYEIFKHANCIGCLKGGIQHWYCVYVHRFDIYAEAMEAERLLDHSILKKSYLSELIDQFELMKSNGIEANEHTQQQTFWANVKRVLNIDSEQLGMFQVESIKPCECVI